MAVPYGAGIGRGRVGVGPNLSRARLLLAKRAGYLPADAPIDPQMAPQIWAKVSRNLNRDARSAGFTNVMQWLREGAQAGGRLPKPRLGQPGGQAGDPLAYSASRLAQRLAGRTQGLSMQAPQPNDLMQMILGQIGQPQLGGQLPGMVEGVAGMPAPTPMRTSGLDEGGGFNPYMGQPRGLPQPPVNPLLQMMQQRRRTPFQRVARRGIRML